MSAPEQPDKATVSNAVDFTEPTEKTGSPEPAVNPLNQDSIAIDETAPPQENELRKLDSKVTIDGENEENDPFRHLPEQEATILRKQLEIPTSKVGFFTQFRYATGVDKLVIAVSSFCAFAGGAALPLMIVVFGKLSGVFQDFLTGKMSDDDFNKEMIRLVLFFIYIAIGEFGTIYIATVGWIFVGERLAGKIRSEYLSAMLRQNVGFFDKLGAGEITTRITADTNMIQDGISEKVGLTMTAMSTFVTSFIIGFVYNWKLTLILTSVVFALIFVMAGGSSLMIKWSEKTQESYALGGTITEEVLSSIRNATAFNTQRKLARQYDDQLAAAEVNGRKSQMSMALMLGGMMFVVYMSYALAFWQGSRMLVRGELRPDDIIIILFAIVMGAFSVGNVAPHGKAFSSGLGAAQKIFSTIDRVSPIDPGSADGSKLEPGSFQSRLELRNIKMIYPSRPEVVVMDDVSLHIPSGKTTALVGASGSGKSTIVGLVERFYDPVAGEVLLDGHDLRTLNVGWLRQNISLVSQEPILFATTIFENIKYGLLGTNHGDPEKVKEMVEEAARKANAHTFITALPEGYETNVGERGFLLSGGQKQRIAIARAIVSDPRILLLDEATSALDTKSEGVVQAALDRAAKGRTTIVIAHRLSTIKNADNIVVMSRGRIVEQGTHDDLLERKAAYYNLVEAQRLAASNRDRSLDVETTEDALAPSEAPSGHISDADPEVDPDDKDLAMKLKRTQTGKSESSIALKQNKKNEGQTEYSTLTLIKFILSFNRTEWYIMLAGMLLCVVAGGGNPAQAVLFAKGFATLGLQPDEYAKLRHDSNFWALMYIVLAVTLLFAFAGNGILFAFCSAKLVRRVRDQAFQAMLRQDIGYFDLPEHNAGALTTFLSTQSTYLSGLSGSTLGSLLTSATTLIAVLIIGIAIGWKLGLVCTATVPVLIFCGYLRFVMIGRFQQRAQKDYEASAGYACEAISAIRTVASLTREQDVLKQYSAQIAQQHAKSIPSILSSSVLYASSQAISFLVNALGFWYGGRLIANREYSLFQFIVCFTAIVFGAQTAGTIFSFAPDMGKARHAAAELKMLFDRKPPIDTWSEDGQEVDKVDGEIEFKDVHFRYPTRPEQRVLRGLSLTVKPGQYVALVGASGCGKSTVISLLERFYDPLTGSVCIDGHDITSLNLRQYRSFLALVSQEPTLYQGTIRDNVLLGTDRNDISDEKIEQACRDANIYEFIMSLPDGFQTMCGSKGVLLSGGQKQRIAIARALIRDPKILLLDEATSALDSESEKVVQAALDAASKGRTTIAVAHRLSTIQKADIIYVIDQGKVVESGTHDSLINLKGRYYELTVLQDLGKMH